MRQCQEKQSIILLAIGYSQTYSQSQSADLIQKFKIGPSAAKQALYHYYRDIQNVKYQCVIIIVYSDNKITIVKDLANIENEDKIKDCFIYALNPIDEFIPNNPAIDQYKCIPIANPYKLEVEHPRPSTVGAQPSRLSHKSTVERSKTVPGGVTARSVGVTGSGVQKKTKDMGLKSTALLAKMKKERAMKEEERQRELQRRKQEELEYRTRNDKQELPSSMSCRICLSVMMMMMMRMRTRMR